MKKTIGSVFTLVLFLLIAIFDTSCQKSINLNEDLFVDRQLKSIHSEVPEIENYTSISTDHSLVKSFLSSESIPDSLIDFTKTILYGFKFKGYKNLIGLQIKFINAGLFEKDIFFVIDTLSQTHLSLIREKSDFQKGNDYPATVKFSSLNGRLVTNDSFIGETIVSSPKIYFNNGLQFTDPNTILSIKSNRGWLCTEEQFNAFYQEAKKKCSDDWLCDFACTFNPCAISYIAYAVVKCTGIKPN